MSAKSTKTIKMTVNTERNRTVDDERGVTTIEYTMVLGFMSVISIYVTISLVNVLCDFKFEAHHSLVPMETFLRCAVTEPLAGPCVELLCDTIAVALRERCLAGALRQVLS